jgi:predicted CoA-substrate-specific enzyme activase
VLNTGVVSTGIDNNGAAKDLLRRLAQERGVDRIAYTMATGYSRKILETADDDVSEITAHAYGVRITAPKGYRPGIIVDIGGQDSKVIYLDSQYHVKNFTMNDKCAAGTGKFMEVIAQILETTIDRVGPLSLESHAPCDINSTCVVFAQSEVISLVARRFDRRDILAGMQAVGIAPRTLRFVHGHAGDQASLLLIAGVRGGGKQLTVLSPLILYGEDGAYTAQAREIYDDKDGMDPVRS